MIRCSALQDNAGDGWDGVKLCLGGWYADARSCSLVLADAPARFTSPRCFLEFHVGRMTPLACRVAPAPAAVAARSSHTASRNARRC